MTNQSNYLMAAIHLQLASIFQLLVNELANISDQSFVAIHLHNKLEKARPNIFVGRKRHRANDNSSCHFQHQCVLILQLLSPMLLYNSFHSKTWSFQLPHYLFRRMANSHLQYSQKYSLLEYQNVWRKQNRVHRHTEPPLLRLFRSLPKHNRQSKLELALL